MLRKGFPIGRIFGISIDLDFSWFLIVALLAWMMAGSYYPAKFPGWPGGEYWMVGIISAVLLFVSVLIHELAHSLVAMRYGIPVPRITLFLFGGVAQIATEPPSAAAEFWITIVGPLTSFALAAFFWEIEPFFAAAQPLYALAEYLALLNAMLAVFNLIPGFPLDGGRVLRAIIWRVTRNYHRATVVAGRSGRFFGFLFIFMGIWEAITGDIAGGLWIAFIGWFLESAAGSQLQQESMKNLLGGHRVADAMQRTFAHAPGYVSLQDLVDHYVLQLNARTVIVTAADGTVGAVTQATLRDTPRHLWPTTPASQVMTPLKDIDTTRPDAVLWSALEQMGRGGVNQLPVVDDTGIVGMLSREDVLRYMGVLQNFQEWKTIGGAH